MGFFKSSNPVLSDKILDSDWTSVSTSRMTIQGTINKTLLFIIATMIFGAIGWKFAGAIPRSLFLVGALVGAGIGFMTYRKPEIAMYSGFAYSALFGILVGAISHMFEYGYPGIVLQSLTLTIATAFAMLFMYKARIIKVTEKFRSIIMIATAGIGIFYLIAIGLGFFGISIPLIHGNGMMGIGFSLFVVGLASMNLLLDFDFIEKGSERGLPKHMEWYGAFGLIVTLIWLYIEILRLLSKLKD